MCITSVLSCLIFCFTVSSIGSLVTEVLVVLDSGSLDLGVLLMFLGKFLCHLMPGNKKYIPSAALTVDTGGGKGLERKEF